jgi:hypothetical protein
VAYLARSVDDVINWSERQISHPTQDWYNLCQSHCRQAYGVPAWAGSAWEAWNKIPAAQKTSTSNAAKAPRGALIYYRGGSYGHVTISIGKSTTTNVLTNDYVRRGKIDKASTRDLPRWGLQVVGYSMWTPYGELRPWKADPMWDGVVPPMENIQKAEREKLANPATYRLACRLFDLGYFSGTPSPEYEQGYPVKAVTAFQKGQGWAGSGKYGTKTHNAVFP